MLQNLSVIKIPVPITEKFIDEHPDYMFLYGWDVFHKGALGQCVKAIGHSNCFPIYTMWKSCKSSGYFQDTQFFEIIDKLDLCFKRIEQAYKPFNPIIPFPKIGSGNSRMKEFAPRCYIYMINRIEKIKYPNIEYVY